MRVSSSGLTPQTHEGEKRCLNSELWHACAGPLVSLPAVGSRVVYFPQGHSEQVAASTNKEVDAQIPNYPSLPPQLICQLHDVTMHADVETDEVYAQMTLQPLSPQEQKEAFFPAELGAPSKQPTNYFCKTLTASDTSTHGGFSVPRRAAEKVFPPLDFSQTPPAQELIARDLHDNEWKFRHIFRGQPKRHLLTTGWSVFVSAKRLVAGDSVLFIWNENNQLLLGIRRANRPQTVMPSSVLSSDSMHIGLLAAAAHAAATNSRFTIFYNPRASPSEFVIPLAKYVKVVYHTRVSIGMRFRMLFETEESSVRRYMGTITGISDLDPARWANSYWRSIKVGWDESTAGERQPRVSLWEIEPLTTFPMYPSPFPLRLKRPWPPGLPSLNGFRDDGMGLNSTLMWLRDSRDWGVQSLNFQCAGAAPWMQPRLDASLLAMQPDMYQAMAAAALQEMRGVDSAKVASPAMLQFQQPQNVLGGSVSLLSNDILQQVQQAQSQRAFYPTSQEGQNLTQTQSHMLLQPQQCKPFTEQHQQQKKLQQQQMQMPHNQQQQLHMPPHSQHQSLPVPQNQEQQQSSLLKQLPTLNNQQQQQPLSEQQISQKQYQQQQLSEQQVSQKQYQQQQLSQPQHLQLAQQQPQQKQHKQPLPQSPHNMLQQTPSPAEQHQQNQCMPQHLQQHVTNRQIPNVVSTISQLVSTSQSPSPTLQSMSQFTQQQNYSDSSGNSVIPSMSPLRGMLGSLTPEEASHVLNMQRSSPLVTSNVWLPNRVGGESMPGNHCVLPQVEQYGQPHANVSLPSVPLSSFSGRECSVDQEVSTDVQNHLLFGVNIDNPSLLVQNDLTDLRNVVNHADSTTMPYTAANFLGVSETEFPLNPAIATSSSLDEASYLQSETVGRVNPQNGTFLKVYKSGSFGRSLDITRFSSYDELRSELGRMFGLEGQLEDPLRSGWQLVIVDRENDVLLLGDDPWHEFVNNVSCIKILSSEEVQQMGKPEADNSNLLSAVPISRLSGSTCDNYISRQDSRNLSNGITSVGSLDY